MEKHIVVVASKREARLLELQEPKHALDSPGPRLVEIRTIVNRETIKPYEAPIVVEGGGVEEVRTDDASFHRYMTALSAKLKECAGFGPGNVILIAQNDVYDSISKHLEQHPLRNMTLRHLERNYFTLDALDIQRLLAQEELLPQSAQEITGSEDTLIPA